MSPGAAPAAIAAAEAEFGFPLPQSFRDSLLVHDGADEGPGLFDLFWMVDLKNIVAHHRETKHRWDEPATDRFIAFGNAHSYNHLLFLDAATSAVWYYLEGDWTLWADDYEQWLARAAAQLESGEVTWDEQDQVFLTERGRYLGAPPPQDD